MINVETDNDVLQELGRRLRALRVSRDVSVAELASRSELNPSTVMNAERGRNPRLQTIVRMLRVLGRLDALDAFLPPPTISPLDAVKRGAEPRQRVSRRSGTRRG